MFDPDRVRTKAVPLASGSSAESDKWRGESPDPASLATSEEVDSPVESAAVAWASVFLFLLVYEGFGIAKLVVR